MLDISDDAFSEAIDKAFDRLPPLYRTNVANVAILYEDEPSPEQRHKLALQGNQTLLGLYEGVPLSERQGMRPTFPDRITLFKLPLLQQVTTIDELQTEIYHTLWHEIAHYYGLNHAQIDNLESK